MRKLNLADLNVYLNFSLLLIVAYDNVNTTIINNNRDVRQEGNFPVKLYKVDSCTLGRCWSSYKGINEID